MLDVVLSSGPKGPPGDVGVRGFTGATGDTGWRGPTGATGLTGATGPSGGSVQRGMQGATGPRGPGGVHGAPGKLTGSVCCHIVRTVRPLLDVTVMWCALSRHHIMLLVRKLHFIHTRNPFRAFGATGVELSKFGFRPNNSIHF